VITRRGFVLGVAGLVFGPVGEVSAGVDSWRSTCRTWMNLLIPADSHGPGADHAATWARLEELMAADPERADWIRMMFGRLAQFPLPVDEDGLHKMMASDTTIGYFVRFFSEFLLESYYGNEMGWHDLGFSDPPQPKGFVICKSV
jgi:hypothetical protein